MESLGRVTGLIFGAVRAPEDVLEGASPGQLARLEERLRRKLPEELGALLTICNGGAIGPGGIYGQRPDNSYLDLPSVLELFPEWAALGWLPVAGDGCGNYWVLLGDGRVGFVDTMSHSGALDRVSDPDLFSFVERILVDDQIVK
jgi:cell wall assembly regulator SMI1